MLTSLAELARNYVQLRGYQESERIVRSNLATAQQAVRLTNERFQGGLATDLDVAKRAPRPKRPANLPQLDQQEQQAINAISLLLGEAPGALAAELDGGQAEPAGSAASADGLPSELARRRPDIRQAEAQLHAATADLGARDPTSPSRCRAASPCRRRSSATCRREPGAHLQVRVPASQSDSPEQRVPHA